MKWLPLFAAILFAVFPLPGDQDSARNDVADFAKSIEGVTWSLRGTRSLKGIHYDGERLRNLAPDGSLGGSYETVFPDRGMVRILFSDDTTGWYFFDENLRWVVPIKTRSERVFALEEGREAKPISNFPEDVLGQVFVSTDDGPNRRPGKFRWNGKKLEFAALHGDRYLTEEMSVFVAHDRILEARAGENSIIWFVFGSDGKEVWFLDVSAIFGGHRADTPGSSDGASEIPGLSPQMSDLADHLIDMVAAGVEEPAWTLMRLFERKYGDREEILDALKRQVAAQ